jgi:hypothetical protein
MNLENPALQRESCLFLRDRDFIDDLVTMVRRIAFAAAQSAPMPVGDCLAPTA